MKKHLPFLFALCCATLVNSQSQNVAMTNWSRDKGTQNTSFPNVVKTDMNENVYITGGKLNSNGDHDIFVEKYDRNGNILWTFNKAGLANGDDVGTDMMVDNMMNVYITGTIKNSTANNNDIITMLLNANGGVVWSSTYNGTSSSIDAGGGIAKDNSGNVYVSGTSLGFLTMADFVTIKYNSSGVQQWATRYNYNNNNEVPFRIKYYSGNIYTAGMSYTNSTKSQYCITRYNASTGAQNAIYRTGGSGNGNDKLMDFTFDATGNTIITGVVKNTGSALDVKTVKLNSSFGVVWTANYNNSNLDDGANALAVDNSGNVYVGGYGSVSGQGKNALLLKYNSSGTIQYAALENEPANGSEEINALRIDKAGDIVAAGDAFNGANSDYYLLKFQNNGSLKWKNLYNHPSNNNDVASDVTVDSLNSIVVTGQTKSSSSVLQYTTIKVIENIKLPSYSSLGTDSFNGTKWVKNLLLVKFGPKAIRMDNISNRDLNSQYANEFLTDSTIRHLADALYPTDPQGLDKMNATPMRKVFTRMTPEDSITTNRLGEKFYVPHFWAVFAVYLNGTNNNLSKVAKTLKKCYPDVIYAHGNYSASLTSPPNDSLYFEQQSLFPSLNPAYAGSDINIDTAWQVSVGDSSVRVGVYDSGIDSMHPDIAVTKRNDLPVMSGVDPQPTWFYHATACAGIIGAKRNNTTGIAGIAGGDYASGKPGAKIYDFDFDDGQGNGLNIDLATEGMVLGASNIFYAPTTPNLQGFYKGEAIHTANHSWGAIIYSTIPGDTGTVLPLPPEPCDLCFEALEYSFRNNVVSCVSRGNWYSHATGATNNNIYTIHYPNSPIDEFSISVGASNRYGHRTQIDTVDNYLSMVGGGIDIVAPGTISLVTTTNDPANNSSSTSPYIKFSGTSSAAPHTTGVAALILSHVNTPCPSNKNLTMEDVEYILQRTADDIYATGSPLQPQQFPGFYEIPGYDDYTGFGKLNAGKALKAIEEPKYQIIHVKSDASNIVPGSYQITQIDTNKVVKLDNPYSKPSGGFSGPYSFNLADSIGVYVADIYKIEATVNHTSNLAHLTGSATIIDKWVRNSSSIGWQLRDGSFFDFTGWHFDSLQTWQQVFMDTSSFTPTSVKLYTYAYRFKSPLYDTSIHISSYYPDSLNKMVFAYSIYVHDPNATTVPIYPCDSTVGIKETKKENFDFSVFPNPSNNFVNVQFNADKTQKIEVYNLMGQLIHSYALPKNLEGFYQHRIDASEFADGLYLITITRNNKVYSKKFIKNK